MFCPMYGKSFIKILENNNLMDPFNYFLEKSSTIYAYTSSSMPPMKGNFSSRIHVDCPRYIDNYITNMGCTIALDDFNINNGATEFLPGSHKQKKNRQKIFFNKKKVFTM